MYTSREIYTTKYIMYTLKGHNSDLLVVDGVDELHWALDVHRACIQKGGGSELWGIYLWYTQVKKYKHITYIYGIYHTTLHYTIQRIYCIIYTHVYYTEYTMHLHIHPYTPPTPYTLTNPVSLTAPGSAGRPLWAPWIWGIWPTPRLSPPHLYRAV